MAKHDPQCQLTEDEVRTRLRDAGLRPTQQRMELGQLLWSKGCRHLTAEQVHLETKDAGISVSLATVYNTLHQFTAAGLLREIIVDRGSSYFDTNTNPHHHLLYEATGELEDIPTVQVSGVPTPPKGMSINGVDVIVRVAKA